MSSSSLARTALGWTTLHDTAALNARTNALLKARKLARRKPLYSGQILDCSVSIPFVSTEKPGTRRPLPNFSRNFKPGISQQLSLRLNHPLQSGEEQESQIWAADVIEKHDNNPLLQSSIIFKLIQPSLYPIPDPDSGLIYDYKNIAKREADFYGDAKELQGDIIPYFFGFQEMFTPSGERAWALLTEYIAGKTVEDFLEEVESQSEKFNEGIFIQVCDVYINILKALHQAHTKNLTFGDRTLGNIILTSSNRPVFVGFPRSEVSEFDRLKGDEKMEVFYLFRDRPVYGEKVVDRVKKMLQKENPELLPNTYMEKGVPKEELEKYDKEWLEIDNATEKTIRKMVARMSKQPK